MPSLKMRTDVIEMVIASAVALAGCGPPATNGTYRFEAEPRAVLESVGIEGARDPKLVVSPSGVIYVLAVHGRHGQSQLSLSISHDGGDTFGAPVPVSAEGASISSHGENSPVLVVTPTEIYAVWEQTGAQGNELMLARSLTFGHHFERPLRLTDKTTPSFNGFSHAAVAPNGDLYVAWLDGRDSPEPEGTFSLYLARSRDRGASFERDVKVASGTCPCCRPTIAIGAHGEVHVFWRKVYADNIRDIAVSTSRDGGGAFDQPVRVAVDNWRINGCPDSGPTAVSVGGVLYVAWLTETSPQEAGIRLTWSDDGGQSFRPALDASWAVLDANHPSLAVTPEGSVLLSFQGRDAAASADWSPLEPFLMQVERKDALSEPISISPGSGRSGSYPSLATGTAGRVFVAWTERESGGLATVMLARGRLTHPQ
jgi:hypothetical protein